MKVVEARPAAHLPRAAAVAALVGLSLVSTLVMLNAQQALTGNL